MQTPLFKEGSAVVARLVLCRVLKLDRVVKCGLHIRLDLCEEVLNRDVASLDVLDTLPERVEPLTIVGVVGLLKSCRIVVIAFEVAEEDADICRERKLLSLDCIEELAVSKVGDVRKLDGGTGRDTGNSLLAVFVGGELGNQLSAEIRVLGSLSWRCSSRQSPSMCGSVRRRPGRPASRRGPIHTGRCCHP